MVEGRLLDDATDAGIEGARVALLHLDGRVLQRALTGKDGRFELLVPAPGRYRLRAQRIGYVTTTSPALDLTQSQDLTIEFRVSALAVTLAPITILGRAGAVTLPDPYLERKGYYERAATYGKQGMGVGFFLEGEQLRPTAFRFSDLLRDLPGIYVRAAGGSRVEVTARAGCRISFYLDGTPIKFDVSEMVASSITAIEVYPGPVIPAEYLGIAPGCGGVVVAWTGVRR